MCLGDGQQRDARCLGPRALKGLGTWSPTYRDHLWPIYITGSRPTALAVYWTCPSQISS